MPKLFHRAALAAVLATCACSGPDTEPALYVSESGFTVSRGCVPGDAACDECQPLAAQWEETTYDVDRELAQHTPNGMLVIGELDGAELDAVADDVGRCLEDVEEVDPAARCLWQRRAWGLAPECTTVLAVRGERSCTAPDLRVLPDDARGSCDAWGKPASRCACRWTVATQDGGRTVVLPAGAPATQAAEAFVRIATGCLYPWLDEGLARCASGEP